MEANTIKEIIFNTVEDLATDFLFYDRKEDEDLSAEQLNAAVESGAVTVDEIAAEFKRILESTFKK